MLEAYAKSRIGHNVKQKNVLHPLPSNSGAKSKAAVTRLDNRCSLINEDKFSIFSFDLSVVQLIPINIDVRPTI